MVVIHVAEGAGKGLIVGAGAAIASDMCRLVYHSNNFPAAIPLIVLSVLAGVIWAWFRKPGPFQAAARADRQLQLDDLLTTALSLREERFRRDLPFLAVVSQAAEAAASRHRADEIRFRQMNPRAWVFAVMLLGMVLTLSMNDQYQSRNIGRTHNGELASTTGSRLPEPVDHPLLDLAAHSDSTTIARPDPVDLTPNRLGQNEAPTEEPSTSARVASESSGSFSSSTTSNGSGSGLARSNSRSQNSSLPTSVGDGANRSSRSGELISGKSGGAERDSSRQDGLAAPGGVVTSVKNQNSPVYENARWQTGSWQSDVENARQLIRSGQSPAAYRDMIRAYFQ